MTAAVEPQTVSDGAKFSRYRSVRRAQEQKHQHRSGEPEQSVPAMPTAQSQGEISTMNRSMSRYHRRPRTAFNAAREPLSATNMAQVPPLPTNPHLHSPAMVPGSHLPSAMPVRTTQEALASSSRAQSSHSTPPKARRDTSGSRPKGTSEPPQNALEEAKRLMQDEAERQQRLQAKLQAEKKARQEAEQAERERVEREAQEAEHIKAQLEAKKAERLKQESEQKEHSKKLQKAEALTRLNIREEEERRAQYDRAASGVKSQSEELTKTSPPVSPPRHGAGFGFFRRRRGETTTSSSDNLAQWTRPRQISGGEAESDTIRPGGGGVIPGIDAPISAVNAGDRRVMVECNKSHILLPVTPTTTPLDLIRSASTCLSENINVKSSVLLESFYKVGLQRPLRNYEHVRDVMNSWDDDKQNSLVIVEAALHDINLEDLVAAKVPDTKPSGMACYMYYSQKPGKWSKRFFTLRSDGQVIMSKNENLKDPENVCHLSDFDIYSPTQRKLAKSVKPPKKICYAVKSQQKSSMFMDESKFVHFFCTSEKQTALLFHQSIHSWRSWYLKHVMGEGQKKPKTLDPSASGVHRNASVAARGVASHSRQASTDSHYQLGSFTPLLDLNSFGSYSIEDMSKSTHTHSDDTAGKLDTKAMHLRKMSSRPKGPPPVSYHHGGAHKEGGGPGPNRLISMAGSANQPAKAETFAASGLLGRTYSERQRALEERDKQSTNSPFTEGPSLLSNHVPRGSMEESNLARKSSIRSHHQRSSSDIQRSVSTRMKPKPLVDLTPQYREPPQHARKGKGFAVDKSSDGPLIANATSLEEPFHIPPSTDWRARPTASGSTASHGVHAASAYDRTRSLRGGRKPEGLAAYAANKHTGVPEDDSNAFTGRGLLSHAGFSQGSVPIGHGVMDGSKARGPMLDMREDSRFAPGSLLAGVPDRPAVQE